MEILEQKESMKHYHSVIQNMPDGYAFHQILFNETGQPIDSVIMEVNHSFEKMTGMNENQIIGKSVRDIMSSSHYFQFSMGLFLQRVLDSEEAVQFEYYLELKRKWVQVSVMKHSEHSFTTILHDITKDKINQIFSSIDDIVFTMDWEQRFTSFYSKSLKDTGFPANMLIGKTIKEVYGIENIMTHQQANDRAFSGEHVVYEWSNMIGGHRVYYQTSLSPLKDDEGRVNGLVGIGRDITLLKSMENELKLTKERLLKAQEVGRIGSWNFDLRSGEVYWSYECFHILGIHPDKVAPSLESYLHYVHPDDRTFIKKKIKEAMDQGESYSFEHRVIRPDGREIWVHNNGQAFLDENYQPIRRCGIIQDITDRKRMEKALKESEERWKFALEGSNVGVWDWDLANGMVVYSKTYKEMLGYDESEFDNTINAWTDLIHPDDLSRVHEEHEKHFRKITDELDVEYRCRCKDESYKWVHGRGKVVNWSRNGKPLRMVGTHTDVTTHKMIEEELIRAKELAESANQMKDRFLSNISHELRTPLNVILGSLQLFDIYLHNDEFNRNYPGIKKYVKIMRQNCYRLLRLLNNLIDITKIESGFLSLRLQNCNIVKIIRDITTSIKEYTETKDIMLTFEANVAEKEIACDPDQIERIILNLLSNAMKFSRGEIHVTLYAREDKVIISVRDNGIGINEDKLQTIFDRFVQVDNFYIKQKEGSGIGLSLVKSLVEMHGGNVTVKSEVEKGSEFRIELLAGTLENAGSSINGEFIRRDCIERINVEFSDIYT